MKLCAQCDQPFTHPHGRVVVCSDACRIVRRKRKMLGYVRKHKGYQGGIARAWLNKRGYLTTTPRANGQTASKLYNMWADMKWRAGTHKNYLHVSVCAEWRTFEGFRPWATAQMLAYGGPKREASIDRADSAGNYTPDNCRFIPLRENAARALLKRWA